MAKRSSLKHLKWLVPLLAFLVFVTWAYSSWMSYKKINPFQLIPSDAIFIMETDRPLKHWDGFRHSPFWEVLSKHEYLEEITQKANRLDSTIHSNKELLGYFGDNHFILSAHMISAYDYNFLFAFDLKHNSNLDWAKLPLDLILDDSTISVAEMDFREKKIVSVYDAEDSSTLYLTQIENYLLCSYNVVLLHSSIEQHSNNSFEGQPPFKLVYNNVKHKGLAQLYINYKYLDDLLETYMDPGPMPRELGKQLAFSAFDLNLLPGLIEIEGFTSLPAHGAEYSRLLQQYGNGKAKFTELLSARTSLAQSIHLRNVRLFYDRLIALRQKDAQDLDQYNALKEQVEHLLGLSLEKHFLSWIGDEMVMAKANLEHEDDLLIAIKASNITAAKVQLNEVQASIKERTPLLFKKMDYRSHVIHYLELKSFFKFIFGARFNKMSKPYYVIIKDYVVFAEDPRTLIALIEDFEKGNTLSDDPTFSRKMADVDGKYCMLSYVNGVEVYPYLLSQGRSELKHKIQNNEAYIKYFNGCLLSMTSDPQGFENSLLVSYGQDVQPQQPLLLDSLSARYLVDRLQTDAVRPLTIERRNSYQRYYPNSEQLMIDAEMRRGELHGDYKEYYPDGRLKVEGKYRRAVKKGEWLYYSPEGLRIE